ncbi:hypothetical protein L0Y40_00795 [Candidatus Wolfebacteria bacterium]|nr:hypothetical protein [Candidatus Wolfebacteria bacterium]
MEVLDTKTIYTLLHILGAVLGAGGAFMSDAMFFSCIKDKKITTTELRFLRLGSTMVWIGLIVLIVSGVLLFSLDPIRYLESSKFLVKMTVVLVILVNGLFFHYMHIPRIERHRGVDFSTSHEFKKHSSTLVASGAISLISWLVALILGSLRSIPYSYAEGMGIYLGVLMIGIAIALTSKKRILGH